jgi:eukaryotic translation initiation factor 2C
VYNVSLRYADQLPLINVGTNNRPIYLPPEICEILPGQTYRGHLSPDATLSMIDFSCRPPAENAEYIVNHGLPFLGLKGNTTIINQLGLSVSPDMIRIPARILPPPSVMYISGQPNVEEASWNILNMKFQKGGDMTRWGILLVQDQQSGFTAANNTTLIGLLQKFLKKCRDSGLTVSNNLPPIMITPQLPHSNKDPGRRNAIATITQTLENSLNLQHWQKPSFVLVLLSGEDCFIYPGIKRLCDMKLGLHTVFMLLTSKKAGMTDPQKLDQYLSNVCLKVNTKLGGTNHMLGEDAIQKWLKMKKTMLVGIDFSCPSPASINGTPCIAAVVANNDDSFAQFPTSLGLQQYDFIDKETQKVCALPLT